MLPALATALPELERSELVSVEVDAVLDESLEAAFDAVLTDESEFAVGVDDATCEPSIFGPPSLDRPEELEAEESDCFALVSLVASDASFERVAAD